MVHGFEQLEDWRGIYSVCRQTEYYGPNNHPTLLDESGQSIEPEQEGTAAQFHNGQNQTAAHLLQLFPDIPSVDGQPEVSQLHINTVQAEIGGQEADLNGLVTMLGVTTDQLPDQIILDTEWDGYSNKLRSGDKHVVNEIFERRMLLTYLHAKQAYEQQPPASVLSLEDCFQLIATETIAKITDLQTANGKDLKKQVGIILQTAKTQAKDDQFDHNMQNNFASIQRARAQYAEQAVHRDWEATEEQFVINSTGFDKGTVAFLYYAMIAKKPLPDQIPDASEASNLFSNISQAQDKVLLAQILGGLSEKERQVIELLYGLNDGRPKTHKETCQIIRAFSWVRVLNIETQALEKIRTFSETADLRINQTEGRAKYYPEGDSTGWEIAVDTLHTNIAMLRKANHRLEHEPFFRRMNAEEVERNAEMIARNVFEISEYEAKIDKLLCRYYGEDSPRQRAHRKRAWENQDREMQERTRLDREIYFGERDSVTPSM